MTAAERKRRYRRRQRDGLAIVPVEADIRALAEALAAAGYLHPRDAESFAAVVGATSAFLADYIAGNASLGPGPDRR